MVSPLRLALSLAAAVGCGALTAVQSRINGELGDRLGDGFVAAFISFGSGLVLLTIAVLLAPSGRRGVGRVVSALRARTIPWWLVLGGIGGASFVLGQGLTVALLGVALFTVAVVAGQVVSSLLLDHHGVAAERPRPATVPRLIGAGLAVVAVVVAVADRISPDVPWVALLIPLASGLIVGWQQAVNGQVRTVAESALTATFGNFLVGTVALGVALLIHVAVAGWQPTFPNQWWLYTGGAIGCIFIAVQAVIVRWTGVLLMGLGLLAGQLGMSVLLDILVPVDGATLQVLTGVGAALVLAAVVIAALPGRELTERSTARSP